MKNLQTYYYNKKMPDPNLGIDIFLAEKFKKGMKFNTHWHENILHYTSPIPNILTSIKF